MSCAPPPEGTSFADMVALKVQPDIGAKLAEARLVKRGMIQELLTGRIRLV